MQAHGHPLLSTEARCSSSTPRGKELVQLSATCTILLYRRTYKTFVPYGGIQSTQQYICKYIGVIHYSHTIQYAAEKNTEGYITMIERYSLPEMAAIWSAAHK